MGESKFRVRLTRCDDHVLEITLSLFCRLTPRVAPYPTPPMNTPSSLVEL